jgi:hypothetical protein
MTAATVEKELTELHNCDPIIIRDYRKDKKLNKSKRLKKLREQPSRNDIISLFNVNYNERSNISQINYPTFQN